MPRKTTASVLIAALGVLAPAAIANASHVTSYSTTILLKKATPIGEPETATKYNFAGKLTSPSGACKRDRKMTFQFRRHGLGLSFHGGVNTHTDNSGHWSRDVGVRDATGHLQDVKISAMRTTYTKHNGEKRICKPDAIILKP